MKADRIGKTVHTDGTLTAVVVVLLSSVALSYHNLIYVLCFIELLASNGSASSEEEGSQTLPAWTNFVNQIRSPPSRAVRTLAVHSAKYPKSTIAAVVIFSLGIFVLGLFTNFSVDVDEDVLCK